MYTVISLCAGIGCMDLAFSLAGFDIRVQVEIDPFCRQVLHKHAAQYWPNVVILEDVRSVGQHNLPANPDVLMGGFPCQDISNAGGGAGIKEGTRSGLWFEFARIISEVRPRYVFLENVAAITSRDGQVVVASLAAMGYDAEWGIIPASAVGAPHERKRWYCVAYTQPSERRAGDTQASAVERHGGISTERQEITGGVGVSSSALDNSTVTGLSHPGQSELATLETETAAGLVIQSERSGGAVVNASGTGCKELNTPAEPGSAGHATRRSDQTEFGRPVKSVLGRAVDGIARQLDCTRWPANPGQQQYRWEAPRTITSKLASRNARLKALGNAVVPQVVQPIAEAIYAILEETNTQDGAA